MPISIPQKKSTKALIDLGISRFQNFKANLLRFEILNQNGALSDFYNDISMLIFGQCCIHSIRNFYQGFKGNEEKNWKNVKIPTMGVALKFQNFVWLLLTHYPKLKVDFLYCHSFARSFIYSRSLSLQSLLFFPKY